MKKNTTAILLIILGLIVLALPLLGLITISILTGFALALVGIGLIIFGYSDMKESSGLGILEIILGIIALIFGLGFILNPALFSFVAGLLLYIAGIFLVIVGLAGVFTQKGGNRWTGVITLIVGLIYLLLGYLVRNPFYLGILIGLWLLIVGIMLLLRND
jgi:uncharacterized membrane protein HdeD (DUF308 family)